LERKKEGNEAKINNKDKETKIKKLEVSFLYGPTVRQLDDVMYSKPGGEERSYLNIRALIIVAPKINIRNSVRKARVGAYSVREKNVDTRNRQTV
jgi:hypothetical protein